MDNQRAREVLVGRLARAEDFLSPCPCWPCSERFGGVLSSESAAGDGSQMLGDHRDLYSHCRCSPSLSCLYLSAPGPLPWSAMELLGTQFSKDAVTLCP